MRKSWLLILLSVFLILVLAGCTQSNGSTPVPDQPQPTPEAAQDTDSGQDEDAAESQDSADTGQDDADTDQDDTDQADADTEQEVPTIDAAAIFADNCAKCHGQNREGGGGPALLPARLTKDPSAYVKTITEGSGPMPTFGGRFSAEEIDALVQFILSEPQ